MHIRLLLILCTFMTTLSYGTPVPPNHSSEKPSNEPQKVPLRVTIQSPHPGFGLEILRVDRLKERSEEHSEERTRVLVRIHSPEDNGMMFPMVISEISDTVYVSESLPPVEVWVVGRTWGWGDEEDIGSLAAYEKRFPDAEPVPFSRTPPAND